MLVQYSTRYASFALCSLCLIDRSTDVYAVVVWVGSTFTCRASRQPQREAITYTHMDVHIQRYEHSPFNTGGGGGSADYLYMLVFGAVCLHAVNLFLGSYVMGSVGTSVYARVGSEGMRLSKRTERLPLPPSLHTAPPACLTHTLHPTFPPTNHTPQSAMSIIRIQCLTLSSSYNHTCQSLVV